MKINRWTFSVCALAAILCIAIDCLARLFDVSFLENIILGILASLIVAMIVAAIGYFHDRETLIAKGAEVAIGVYINLRVLSRSLGILLGDFRQAPNIMNERFDSIIPLAKMNVELYDDILPSLFSPFCKKSNVSLAYSTFCSFKSTCSGIYLLLQELIIFGQRFDIAALEAQRSSNLDMNQMQLQAENLSAYRDIVLVKAAKLHEHITDRGMQYESAVHRLVDRAYGKSAWEQKEKDIADQVEEIVASMFSSAQ